MPHAFIYKLTLATLATFFLGCGELKQKEALNQRSPGVKSFGQEVMVEERMEKILSDDPDALPSIIELHLQSRSGTSFSLPAKYITSAEGIMLMDESDQPIKMTIKLIPETNEYFLVIDPNFKIDYGVRDFNLYVNKYTRIPFSVVKADFHYTELMGSSFSGQAGSAVVEQYKDGFQGWVNSLTPVVEVKKNIIKHGFGHIIN